MFEKLFKKKKPQKTTEVTFKNTVCDAARRVGCQSGERDVHSWEEVERAIRNMLNDPEEFVILTVGDPRHGIRFIQATRLKNGNITVELALESADGTRLVDKECSEQECLAVFREFYNTTDVPGREQYKAMEFYK